MATNSRICSFAIRGDGSRSFGLHVGGLNVLVTAPDGMHDAGAALASVIAGLGPEGIPAVVPPSAPPPETPVEP